MVSSSFSSSEATEAHKLDVLLKFVYIERLQEVLGEVLGAAEGHVDKGGRARAGGPDAPLVGGGEGD